MISEHAAIKPISAISVGNLSLWLSKSSTLLCETISALNISCGYTQEGEEPMPGSATRKRGRWMIRRGEQSLDI
jgi:hypothetical protein